MTTSHYPTSTVEPTQQQKGWERFTSLNSLSWLIGLLGAVLFLIVLTGPADLSTNENRMGAYILDAVQNGHWLCQVDATGSVGSKPPLIMWLAGLITLVTGKLSRFSLYLPSALATVCVAIVILREGHRRYGWQAGLLAALAYLLSPVAVNQFDNSRYDAFFAWPLTVGALAAYYAWQKGSGWTWFWLAMAAATLVKGPLCFLLCAGGFLSLFWKPKGEPALPLRGSHWLGLGLFLLIGGGWFLGAYWQMGQPFIDKLIFQELLHHVVEEVKEEEAHRGFYYPTYAFISGLAPGSLFALLGLWRIWKHPSRDPENRRFERFLFCFIATGIVLFSLAGHQRARLVQPLLPLAALLAGRELARLTRLWNPRILLPRAAGAVLAGLVLVGLYEHAARRSKTGVLQTTAARNMAQELRQKQLEHLPLTVADRSFTLQFYLNRFHRNISVRQAAVLLQGSSPTFVVTSEIEALRGHLATNGVPLHILMEAPGKKFTLYLVSNQPRLQWPDAMTFADGPLQVQTRGARLETITHGTYVFAGRSPDPSVEFTNTTTKPIEITTRFLKDPKATRQTLAPGASWRFTSVQQP